MQSIMKNGTLSFGGNDMERHTSENVKMFPARLPRIRHRNELTEREESLSAPPKRGEPWKRIEGSWWGGDG